MFHLNSLIYTNHGLNVKTLLLHYVARESKYIGPIKEMTLTFSLAGLFNKRHGLNSTTPINGSGFNLNLQEGSAKGTLRFNDL